MHRTLKPENERRLVELITRMIADLHGRASVGPADVARRFDAENWKRWMEDVKSVAHRLASEGVLEVTRHGKPVTTWPWRGVIRLRRVQPPSALETGPVAADPEATAGGDHDPTADTDHDAAAGADD